MAISIDDLAGSIVVGGDATDGTIVLRDGAGGDRVRFNAQDGSAWLGGNGADGDLVLFRAGGDNQSLAQATIHIDGQNGNYFAGGSGTDGDIVLNNAAGHNRIRLNAKNGAASLGGNGADGDLLIFPATGDNRTPTQATIQIDGRTGDIRLSGADCAELFSLGSRVDVEPGTVLVLDESGNLRPCEHAYDGRVVGVVSGAGNHRPGVVLDLHCKDGVPIALVGKVWCKADASQCPIAVGDLLTTSSRIGHAMKAAKTSRAFGAVLGKAMGRLQSGQGLIPILVTLQ